MATTRTQRPRAATGDNLKPVLSIDASEDPQAPIPIKLVGKLYVVTPPKGALALRISRSAVAAEKSQSGEDMLASIEALERWIEEAFGDKSDEILERLEDSKDRLDHQHVYQLMEALAEYVTANPTT